MHPRGIRYPIDCVEGGWFTCGKGADSAFGEPNQGMPSQDDHNGEGEWSIIRDGKTITSSETQIRMTVMVSIFENSLISFRGLARLHFRILLEQFRPIMKRLCEINEDPGDTVEHII